MARRNIIVVGASAGGSEALSKLCSTLPSDFKAAVFVVWHLGKMSEGYLPKILEKNSNLPVKNAEDDEEFKNGNIYIAPPDRHLIIQETKIRTTKGPKENRFRPSVDPLFRSAAYYFTNRVIGIILSGTLNDGTAGLWAIKDNGGISIVQNPLEAQFSGMPEDAIKNVEVDFVLPVNEIGRLLPELIKEEVTEEDSKPAVPFSIEVEMAQEKKNGIDAMKKIGELTSYTCPECHGTLWKILEGKLLRFRCHTGHAYTAEYLLEHLEETLEDYMWNIKRGMSERINLLEQLTDKNSGHSKKQETYEKRIKDAAEKIKIIDNLINTGEKTDRIPD
jgi:two-component system, chemotaxis family, protein-glutamate methylesterase/glutaminase